MDASLEEFKRHLTALREAKTVESYMVAVRRFVTFWDGKEYTPTTLQEFVVKLSEDGLSPASVHMYYMGARSFLNWSRSQRAQVIPEQAEVTLPRINEGAPKVIRPEDLREFMEGARQKEEPYRTCLMILPLTGLRIGEAVSLELTNVLVTPGGYTFLVKDTKGKRDRYVPLLKSGNEMFAQYLTRVRPSLAGDRWVFPSPKSSRRGMMPIHPRVVQDLMKDIREARGLDFTPHTLRHVYATVLHRNKVSDLAKMKILGHRNVTTTNRYVHMNAEELHSDVANVETPWADEARPTDEGDEDVD